MSAKPSANALQQRASPPKVIRSHQLAASNSVGCFDFDFEAVGDVDVDVDVVDDVHDA